MSSVSTLDPGAFAAASQAASFEALVAGSKFGARLRATPEFSELLRTNDAMGVDPAARAAMEAYAAKQEEYRVEAAMNLLDESRAAELGRLLNAMYDVPSVSAYSQAMEAFGGLCRETAAVISGVIGIDFAANCRSGGCCGG